MSESFHAWWLGQVAEAHWRRLVKEGTIQPVIPERRKRGRPPKPKTLFRAASKTTDILALSERIASALGVARGSLTDTLAEAGLSYEVFAQVRTQAPLAVRRRGNRPNIHLALLLADCARAHEAETGEASEAELRKIGGWEADQNAPPSQVLAYAHAVLTAMGINHTQSLRQQARRAIDHL